MGKAADVIELSVMLGEALNAVTSGSGVDRGDLAASRGVNVVREPVGEMARVCDEPVVPANVGEHGAPLRSMT
jgi:hypothetical protein